MNRKLFGSLLSRDHGSIKLNEMLNVNMFLGCRLVADAIYKSLFPNTAMLLTILI